MSNKFEGFIGDKMYTDPAEFRQALIDNGATPEQADESVKSMQEYAE